MLLEMMCGSRVVLSGWLELAVDRPAEVEKYVEEPLQ
jgi:hypothetical protein